MAKEIESNGGKIHHNLPSLTKNTTNINGLMDYLFSKNIISLRDKQHFISEKSDEEKCSQLYTHLMKVVTDTTFQQIIDALKETGNTHIAELFLYPTKPSKRMNKSASSSLAQRGSKHQWDADNINKQIKNVQKHDHAESSSVKSKSVPCSKLGKWWPKKQMLIKCLIPRKAGKLLIVQKLKELLYSNKDNTCVLGQMAALAGMGGIGKTTIAKWFAHYYETEYDHFIWLDCGEGNTEKSLREFAGEMKIKLITDEKEKRATHLVVEQVYSILKSAKCLFIFDNVFRYIDVQNFLPTTGNKCHHSLITSRYQYWGNENESGTIQVFKLGIYSEYDAEEFLKSAVKNINKPGNEIIMRNKLAVEMGYLPLALQIAVSTINKLNWSVSEYLKQTKNSDQIKFHRITDSYQMSLKLSLEVSISVIEKNESASLAKDILKVFAFIAPDDVRKDMLVEIFSEHSKSDIDIGLELLQDYSLISCSELNNDMFNIHRLLQDVVRIRTGDSDVTVLSKLLSHFSGGFSKNEYYRDNHIASVWQHAMEYDDVVDSFWTFFVQFVENKLLKNGRIALLQASVLHLDRVLGVGHVTTCKARFQVGHILFESKKYKQSCDVWEFILDASPPSDLDDRLVSSVHFNLGVVNEWLGKFEEAILFYDKVIAVVGDGSAYIDNSPFQIKFCESIQDCKITSTSKVLNKKLLSQIKLQCKIIFLQATLNDLQNAWRRMQFFISNSTDVIYSLGSYRNWISVAGLKLLTALSKSKSSTSTITAENKYKLLNFLCTKFTQWGMQVAYYLRPVYWNTLATIADSIALDLLNHSMENECVTVYELLLQVGKCISEFDFEASTQFLSQICGSEVMQKLKLLNRNNEACRIRVLSDSIKSVFEGNFPYIVRSPENAETQHGNATTVHNKEESCHELSHFTAFKSNVNPVSVTEINFIHVKFCKYDLLMALNSCPNLEKVILQGVHLIGGCRSRIHLPKLRVFVIRLKHYYCWLELIKQHGLLCVMNSLSFFYKDADSKDWELNACNHLGLERFSISVDIFNSIDIDSVSGSVQCCLPKYNVDEILRSINFSPTTLKLNNCELSVESSLTFWNIKQLTLRSVVFPAAGENGIEMCQSLLHHFPQLEELDVSVYQSTAISININKLPLKLKKLKLSHIKILKLSVNEIRLRRLYESLTLLTLKEVIFLGAGDSEIELSHSLLHFPHLEELHVYVDKSSTPISLEVNRLPLKLSHLKLEGTELLYGSRNHDTSDPSNSVSAQLKTIILDNVVLPNDESAILQSFRTIQKVVIGGYGSRIRPTASLLKQLIEIDSIQEIYIYNFDWTSDTSRSNTEFVNWLQQLEIPVGTGYFQLAKIQPAIRSGQTSNQLWRGKKITFAEFKSHRRHF